MTLPEPPLNASRVPTYPFRRSRIGSAYGAAAWAQLNAPPGETALPIRVSFSGPHREELTRGCPIRSAQRVWQASRQGVASTKSVSPQFSPQN